MQRNTRNFSPVAEPPRAQNKPAAAAAAASMGNELGAALPQAQSGAPSAPQAAQSSLGRAISHLGK